MKMVTGQLWRRLPKAVKLRKNTTISEAQCESMSVSL